MGITWSTSELDMIKKQTMSNLRPSYYSTTNKNYIQISEDFEGFLIIQAADNKQKLLKWMSDIGGITNDVKDQNKLLTAFIAVRDADANAQIVEIDNKLNDYAEMQATLLTDGTDPARYASIIELDLMLTSISKSVDNITIQRDQAFHELCVTKTVENKLNIEAVSDEAEKEMSSWQSIVSSYKGQTESSGGSKVGLPSPGGLF